MYTLYRIHITHTLHAVCEVCSVFTIHYKCIVEVLGKTIRRIEMIDTSSKGNFMLKISA